MLYAIADTHLSFGVNKPMDGFGGWTNYVQRLSSNWNRLVTPEDTVVIAGDISWGMNFEEALPDFRFLHELPGRKLIMKGNHDYWWNTRRKMDAFFEENGLTTLQIVHNSAVDMGTVSVCGSRGWFFDAGSDADQKVLSREVARVKMSIDAARQYGNEPLVFLHYPPITGAARCEPILNLLKSEGIRRCYYGHLHGMAAKSAVQQEVEGIRFSLISADYLEFCPKFIEKTGRN